MFFGDFEEATGQTYLSRRRTITETDLVMFTQLTGITDPVFTDDIFAREQLFGGRVVPGPLVLTYALGMTDDLGFGAVLAALAIDNARFVHPVRPSDTITVETTVANARASASRPDAGIVTLAHRVFNQDGTTVQSFERTLLIRRDPAA
ncbi:MaoC family dehydratase [Actinophytocola sp.]|uniref:MaoC family dehydratase n=1 Tax=Actinophytocola sp. TaxID=1872138 RepID=UPI003D6AAA35